MGQNATPAQVLHTVGKSSPAGMSLASYASSRGAASRDGINFLAREGRSRSKGVGIGIKTTTDLQKVYTQEVDEFAKGDHSIAGQALRSMHDARQRLCKTRKIIKQKTAHQEEPFSLAHSHEHLFVAKMSSRKRMDSHLPKHSFSRKAPRPRPGLSGLSSCSPDPGARLPDIRETNYEGRNDLQDAGMPTDLVLPHNPFHLT